MSPVSWPEDPDLERLKNATERLKEDTEKLLSDIYRVDMSGRTGKLFELLLKCKPRCSRDAVAQTAAALAGLDNAPPSKTVKLLVSMLVGEYCRSVLQTNLLREAAGKKLTTEVHGISRKGEVG